MSCRVSSRVHHLNHTMAPEDDFLDVGHPAQSLSEALSRRSSPLRGMSCKNRVTIDIKVFHRPLGCHVVDLTRSLQPSAQLLDCVQHVKSSSENPWCLDRNGAEHSLSCLIHTQVPLLPPSVAMVGFLVSWAFWRASRPSSRPVPRCNLKGLSPGIHLKHSSTPSPFT